jgi:ribosomal RNA methyltransferase Nop2
MTTKQRYNTLRSDFTTDHDNPRPALRFCDEDAHTYLDEAGISTEPISWLRNGHWHDKDDSLTGTLAYAHGLIYKQGAASQVPAAVLSPDEDSTVLDMCAAPGSKTTQLASMTPRGGVVALDTNHERLRALQANVERLGLDNVVAYKKDARFADDLDQSFDYVLLDAPCSGNYVNNDAYFQDRTEEDISRKAKTQQALIDAAHDVLSPGGRLVYSTCSLDPRENEAQVHEAITFYDDLSLCHVAVEVGTPGLTAAPEGEYHESLKLTRRFWPQDTGTEGFFVACLQKQQ